LKTQIDGFTAVSSGVTALQGTVTALQAAVAALPKSTTPATDISGLQTALTALSATVAELKTSLATAATAADVATLSTSLAQVQADLSNLLASNNIYSTAVVINTQATLDFAVALGDKLTIVNNTVSITQTSAMDAAVLQSVMSKMTSVTQLVTFDASATGITTTPSFTRLTGAANITLTQKADVSLPVLVSTGALTINDDNKITSISAPKLTTITSFPVSSFNKVVSVDLSSLKRLPGALTLTVDSGTVDFSSLITTTDVTVPVESNFAISISGATIVKVPLITGGKLTMANVVEPNLPLWKGAAASSFARATKVVLPSLTGAIAVSLNTWAPKAKFFHMIGTEFNSPTSSVDDSTFPTFTTGAANGNVETLILGGDIKDVTVDLASDLTSYTHTGNTHNVTFTNNVAISAVTFGHTAKMNSGAKGVSVSTGKLIVTGNTEMTSLKADSLDDISDLTIKGNTELTTLSFAALNSLGTKSDATAVTVANVDISGNKLTASKIQLPTASGTLPVVAGKITEDAGLKAISTWIGLASAKDAAGMVTLDDVTSVLLADGNSATGTAFKLGTTQSTQTWTNENDAVNVVESSANTADTGSTARGLRVAHQVTFAATTLQISVGGSLLYVDNVGGTAAITPGTNVEIAIAAIKSSSALSRATAAGVTLNAVGGGAPISSVKFEGTASATTGEAYAGTSVSSATTMGTDDFVTLTIGTQSVTATGTGVTSSTIGIASALSTAWNAKWGAGGTSQTASLFNTDANTTSGTIKISAKSGSGNRGNGAAVSITATAGTVTATDIIIDYVIGSTRATTDNSTVGTDIILTIENNTKGTIASMPNLVVTTTGVSSTLTTTETFNKSTATLNNTNTASDIYENEGRGLAQLAEDSVGATTSNGRSVDLTTWL
jgi:hypothetical protein